MTRTWQTPTVPFTLTDAVNRMALATGSTRSAMAGASASYNGHRVHVDTGLRAGWRAHYTWAGLNWLTRGATFERALLVALTSRGATAKGGLVRVNFSEFSDDPNHDSTPERVALLRESGLLPKDEAEAIDATWKDWRFAEVGAALSWDKTFGMGGVALLLTMTPEQSREDYIAARSEIVMTTGRKA